MSETTSIWWDTALARAAISALVVVASAQAYRYFTRRNASNGKPLPQPPGKHWLYGHIPLLGKYMKPGDHIDVAVFGLMRDYPELGKFFQLDFKIIKFAIVCDPSAIREIIVTQNLPKSPTYTNLHPFIGRKSILVAGDAVWSKQRKAFNPGFASQYLRSLVPLFVERCQLLFTRLDKIALNKSVTLMHEELTLLTMDVITQAVLSLDLGFLTNEQPPPLFNAFVELVIISANLAERPYMYPLRYLPWNIIHFKKTQWEFDKHIVPIIKKRIKESNDPSNLSKVQSKGRQDILDLALASAKEEGGQLDLEEVMSQIKTFLFAGHDTTSSAVAFTIYEISRNPKVEATLIEEIDRVLEGRLPTAEDLPALKYTTAVFKESLRVWPLGGTARMGPPGTTVNGYDVGNVVLYLPHIHIHRSTEEWGPDAGEFNPDRWLDDKYVTSLNPYAYTPFSKGPRDCIGQTFANMEGKTLLAMLYQRYTFKYAGEKPEEQGNRITSFPKYHVPVTVHPRSK